MTADQPRAVHLEVRVDARIADANEQMLAAADGLVHLLAGEVDGSKARHPHVAPGECSAIECLAQLHGRPVHGVPFGHAYTLPARVPCYVQMSAVRSR